ncbi:MAG: DUF6627 family protein [Gammaproteobacteria bacterium]|nr:DUF6627 family protein [Gammaproteobacteria bacterium]
MMSFKHLLTLILSVSLLGLSFANVQAAIISNNQIINEAQQKNQRQAILQTIARKDVQQQLFEMGVNPADIENRINQMTQQEIAQLNQQMNELPAGAGILGIIVLVFIVFVITDVIGATDIFPFIHPVK